MGAAFAAAELISLWVWIHTNTEQSFEKVHIVKPLTFLLLLQGGALTLKIRAVSGNRNS